MSEMRLPDFIIGGAPRAGTTWLCELADRHPNIRMAKPRRPEPKFFLRDDLFERGLRYYSETWFKGIPPSVRAGEKSTNYLESATAASRMAGLLPEVRLIFVLRDPVARAFSNYRWSRLNGLENEDFATALALERRRESQLTAETRFARPHAYFSRGLYADLLLPYLRNFPRERILVLRFEDAVARPEETAAVFHRFVGVEPRPADAADLGVINAAEGEPGEILDPALRDDLTARYAEPNRRLQALLGEGFKIWTA